KGMVPPSQLSNDATADCCAQPVLRPVFSERARRTIQRFDVPPRPESGSVVSWVQEISRRYVGGAVPCSSARFPLRQDRQRRPAFLVWRANRPWSERQQPRRRSADVAQIARVVSFGERALGWLGLSHGPQLAPMTTPDTLRKVHRRVKKIICINRVLIYI